MDFHFNKLAAKRKAYYESKGLSVFPQTQHARLTEARISLGRSDYNTALILYDNIDDFDHPDFLELMGDIHSDKKSPVYNLEDAKKFYIRSYAHNPSVEGQKSSAKKILKAHQGLNRLTFEGLFRLHEDPILFDCVMFLCGQGEEPEIFKINDGSPKSAYIIATYAGAGRGMPRDHKTAVEMYESYLSSYDHGYLAAAYKNLAIRYALGLGCNQNHSHAYNLLRLGRIFLEKIPYRADDPILDLLSKVNSETHIHRNVASHYNKVENAWSFLDIIHDAQPSDRNPIVNALFLYAFLAKHEKWEDTEEWRGLYNYALSYFSMDSRYKNYLFGENDGLVAERFHPQIVQQENSRLNLRNHRIRMYEYFREHNLGIPPVNSFERIAKLREFTDSVPPNYEAALILYDKEIDGENPDWLNLVGSIYYEHLSNPYHSFGKSKEFYLKSATLGNAHAMRNLGIFYENGSGGPIDPVLAEEWYKRAIQHGNVVANADLADLITKFDPKYNKDENTDKRIYELVQAACGQEDSLSPLFKDAKLGLAGRGVDYNDIGIITYILTADALKNNTDQFSIVLRSDINIFLGIRSYLGLSMTEDRNSAISYFERITSNVNSVDVKRRLYPQVRKFLEIVNEDDHQTTSTKEIISSLYRNPQAQLNFMNVIEGEVLDARKYKKKSNISKHMVDMFWMVHKLAEKEDWKDQNSWQRIVRSLHAARYGLTYKDIERSTMTDGPRYNHMDNGAPILGDIAKPAIETERHNVDLGAFIPSKGIYGIAGLTAENNGGIHFDFIDAPKGIVWPARILKEDIDIALVLAFARASGPIEPYLSLEGGGHKKISDKKYPYRDNFGDFEDPHDLFMYKVWDPTWLGHTAYGRTMYIVDNLLTICSAHAKNFSVVEGRDENSRDLAALSRDLVQEILLAGGHDPDHETARVMNAPQHIAAVPEGYVVDGKQIIKISLPQIKMMVEGSYILGKDSQIAKDDPQYALGRKTQIISQRFSDLCQIMPVYHRYQQIMGLQHALSTLRNEGFRPHPDLMKDIHRNYEYYNSLPPVPNNELLSIHLPFTP